jgi:phospholipid/cholesterol/gamma-HCH transport system substrate-binding protein
MPQRKEIAWTQLRVGIMVAVSLIVLAVGIFYIGGQVGFLTPKYTIRSYFASAGGLRVGSQVRLAGIAVGNVSRIRISPYTDPDRAVEIDMRISRHFQNEIRADSMADSATAGLLGEAYIDISRGSPGQPVIPDGGEVKSHQEKDIKEIVQNADDVVSNLRVLSNTLNDITNQISAGKGSIGKLIYSDELYNRFNDTTKAFQTLVFDMQKGHGTLGKFLADETVYQKTVATLDRLNHLMDDVQRGNGTVGKLISDPTIYNDMREATNKANALIDKINKGQGTLGKLVTDDQLYAHLNSVTDNLDVVTGRMKQGQGTLGLLSTDKTLYNNLSESSKSLREFLTEFRQNPRKYLTIHVRIF